MSDGQTNGLLRVAFIVALLALLLTYLTQKVISEGSKEQSRVIEGKKDSMVIDSLIEEVEYLKGLEEVCFPMAMEGN